MAMSHLSGPVLNYMCFLAVKAWEWPTQLDFTRAGPVETLQLLSETPVPSAKVSLVCLDIAISGWSLKSNLCVCLPLYTTW